MLEDRLSPPALPKTIPVFVSRIVSIAGSRQSLRLDRLTWSILEEVTAREQLTVDDICARIYWTRPKGLTLANAVRLFLVLYFREASTEDGHARAGHGQNGFGTQAVNLAQGYRPLRH
jgi:predicted DNA-binding ribbon-helix-helix protein